jgi:glycosyltransferase involved in cell wall biosynthesis
MRLLFLNEHLDYGSTTSYTQDLALALLERGDQVQICTAGGALREDFQKQGVETYLTRFNLLSFRMLRSLLKEYDPELIHVQSLHSLPFGRRIIGGLRKPYVVSVHRRPGAESPRLDGSSLCGIIATNELIREALVNEQGLPKWLIRVIRRGVNLAHLKPEAAALEERLDGRLPVIGSVGRLQRSKGHHTLIAAARLVLDRGAEAHFAIVGEGEEEPDLRALVKRLDLQHHVTFTPHVPRLSELYKLFDIVALPVLRSGVGVTALEAMAMAKPVIASGVGEMLHLIEDGRTGFLIPEGDAGALASRICELIANPGLMASLGRRARQAVEEGFALRPMVESTVEFYAQALASHREGQLEEGRARWRR